MKKPITMLSAALSMLVGCKNEATRNDTEPAKIDSITSSDKAVETGRRCYEFVQKKDTISLSFDQNGINVKGDLRFKNYEKDSSDGPISGAFAGDTLKLTYEFSSEGTKSIREVYLLKDGDNSLLMGSGEMNEKGNKQVFTNPKAIVFDKSIVLIKTECK